jgi:hypothetical protein
MRVHRQTGRIDAISTLIVIAILGILLAVVGGHYSEKSAKIQRSIDIDKNWREKNCDYFLNQSAEETTRTIGRDIERAALYHKLFSACLGARDTQPKTPE